MTIGLQQESHKSLDLGHTSFASRWTLKMTKPAKKSSRQIDTFNLGSRRKDTTLSKSCWIVSWLLSSMSNQIRRLQDQLTQTLRVITLATTPLPTTLRVRDTTRVVSRVISKKVLSTPSTLTTKTPAASLAPKTLTSNSEHNDSVY
jgi:hypothetical protein